MLKCSATGGPRDLDGDSLGNDWVGSRWSRVCQQEIVDPNFSVGRLKKRFEELNDDSLKAVSAHGIEVVFAVTTNLQDTSLFKQRQVVADRWLALVQAIAELRDVEFCLVQQVEDDAEPVAVRKHFTEMGQLGSEFFG